MPNKLTNDDFCRAAKTLRCDVSAIKAVAEVESRGEGFYSDGFPVILFERHKFRSFTHGQYNESHPQISGPAGNYGSAGQNQKNKFNIAFKLDPEAAMKSCSWGKFQIMGFNYAICGYKSVGEFVDAMKESEGKQLDAFVQFVIHTGLADELRRKDFAGFAEGYNGSGYKTNKYDTKMAAADKRFAKENIDCSNSAAAPLNTQTPATGNTSVISEPETQPPPPNDHKELKAEVTPEGGLKVSSSEGPPAPKERVAVVAGEKQKWTARVSAKVTGAVTGNIFFQWIWAQMEKIGGLPIPTIIWVIVSSTIGLGTLIWLIHEVLDTWQYNKRQERLDALLITQNSTPENLAQLIPADEVDIYRARGFKIITRGEALAPQK